MDINTVFTEYGYDKIDFETLPESLKNYLYAMQAVESGMIPALISDMQARAVNTNSVVNHLQAEMGTNALQTLAAYIRVAMKEQIITVVDRMNSDANRTSTDVHAEETSPEAETN